MTERTVVLASRQKLVRVADNATTARSARHQFHAVATATFSRTLVDEFTSPGHAMKVRRWLINADGTTIGCEETVNADYDGTNWVRDVAGDATRRFIGTTGITENRYASAPATWTTWPAGGGLDATGFHGIGSFRDRVRATFDNFAATSGIMTMNPLTAGTGMAQFSPRLRAGEVTGIVFQSSASPDQTITLRVRKNGADLTTLAIASGAGSPFRSTMTRAFTLGVGSFSYAAGDSFDYQVTAAIAPTSIDLFAEAEFTEVD